MILDAHMHSVEDGSCSSGDLFSDHLSYAAETGSKAVIHTKQLRPALAYLLFWLERQQCVCVSIPKSYLPNFHDDRSSQDDLAECIDSTCPLQQQRHFT